MHPSRFALPDRLARKSARDLIAADDEYFAAIDEAARAAVVVAEERLANLAVTAVHDSKEIVERDADIRLTSGRLALLRRRGADLCIGRMTPADAPGEPVYIGRLGVTGADGRELLLDWRSPAAAPFFEAGRADPRGLLSRRRYRWAAGRVCDYWDEALTDEAVAELPPETLDAESAFLAALDSTRTTQMRDVLSTLAADQNTVVRTPATGTLVVDGGPGTGKTVVALHRVAHLLYADPRVGRSRGGVLFVGPTERYLDYVAGVLPDLGDEGTRFTTLTSLVPEGRGAVAETDAHVAALKAGLTSAIEAAVAFYEDPPAETITVETDDAELEIRPADWRVAFDAVEPGTPHNEARPTIHEALLERLGIDDDSPEARGIWKAVCGSWPLIEPTDLVADLWTVPAYLRSCAPDLSRDEVAALRRRAPQTWTVSDLPLLDAARFRLGDASAERRHRERAAAATAHDRVIREVVDELVAVDDDGDGDGLIQQFAYGGMASLTTDESALPEAEIDPLSGAFAHIVVDEAQELTDAEWAMLRRRCPSGRFTVVGDRAQARTGFTETWVERLRRVGLRGIEVAALSINYRTPREVMDRAAEEIVPVLADANIPDSVRESGTPVRECPVPEAVAALDDWLSRNDDGIACVIGTPDGLRALPDRPRVTRLDPTETSGLEFDLVVVVEPDDFGDGLPGAVSRYIAMTRATSAMIVAAAPADR
ncbi:MAG: RNA polymerase recycling motor ATPase HelR [Gordonia sp. (in: high G+C Gram-positive bacteria)]|uniref:RNA polymerase recycling motor ATPase HelR n=1 Tax=Gordonia sp. (in: high G+C Gram-positive bacteria) TaxID=84139 RepID=UPI0039E30348